MPLSAKEIMDRNFLDASQADSIFELLREMEELGLESAPVLDGAGHPIGMVTARNVESCHDIRELAEHLTHSAVCIDQNTPVELAAWTAAVHRASGIVLVDESGVAVGALSALDLLRAMVGLDAHDAHAPHDQRSVEQPVLRGWSNPEVLEVGAALRTPETPGVILLLPEPSPGRPKLWAEATLDIQDRLDQMLRTPQSDPVLEAILEAYPRNVTFRYLMVSDAVQRERLTDALCNIAKVAGASAQRGAPKGPPPKSGIMPKVEPQRAAKPARAR